MGSIRPRILKAQTGIDLRIVLKEVAVGSIRPRILKECMNPMSFFSSQVAVGSIRPRILKGFALSSSFAINSVVAVGSIRPRILKDGVAKHLGMPKEGCSGLDPTEDTESCTAGQQHRCLHHEVAVGSIRPRILKDPGRPGLPATDTSCSGLDPTEDTESLSAMRAATSISMLQWARSDRGY